MVKYSNETVNFDLYEKRIRQSGYVLYDRTAFKVARNMLFGDSGVLKLMAIDTMAQRTRCRKQGIIKEQVLSYLIDWEGVPEHYFIKDRSSSSLSIDMKKCLSVVYENGYASEFLEYYMEHRSLLSLVNKMDKLMERFCNETAVNEYGLPLSRITYSVSQQANFRYNYKDPDIIAVIPKRTASCLSVEKGYLLDWGDFAQSDFRVAYNLFLRSEENDRLMLKYEDKYEALARMVAKELGHKFDYEEFKRDRKLYKTLTLATMYGTRGSKIKEQDTFISVLSKFLMRCPKYKAYYSGLNDLCQLGLPLTITSYFNNEQASPEKSSIDATVNRALNCPVQSGTSELVILTVNKILDCFYSRGYTEDDICVYCVRHDEPVFKMKKEVMKDSWIFENFKTILVDDWTPLSLTFEFGYNYLVADKDLTARFNKSVAENASRIDTVEGTSGKVYKPVPSVLKLQVYNICVPGHGTVIAYYDESRNKVHYSIAQTEDVEQIKLAIRQELHSLSLEAGYKGVIVSTACFEGEDYNQAGLYIRYKLTTVYALNKATNLAKYATCVYCKSVGAVSPVNPPVASYEVFVRSVTKFEEMEA